MNDISDYNKYLSGIHQDLNTPEEIIREVVKEGTGTDLLSKKRIIAGEVNEVYDITLNNHAHVILRISKEGFPNFQQEKWAIAECKKVGVPVPEIILIKYIIIDSKERSMCLMEKMDGTPLERSAIDFDKLDIETKKKLIYQAGKILSKIHSISTKGFGWIKGSGEAEYNTFQDLLLEKIQKREKLEIVAAEEGLGKHFISNAFRIVEKFKDIYSEQTTVLNHGDFSNKHFMVKENVITGILDWGSVRSDSAVYDFATWDYWFGEDIPTEWLMEGYQDKSLFDSNFNDFVHMLRTFNSFNLLEWYYQRHQDTLNTVKKNLLKDLEYFS